MLNFPPYQLTSQVLTQKKYENYKKKGNFKEGKQEQRLVASVDTTDCFVYAYKRSAEDLVLNFFKQNGESMGIALRQFDPNEHKKGVILTHDTWPEILHNKTKTYI